MSKQGAHGSDGFGGATTIRLLARVRKWNFLDSLLGIQKVPDTSKEPSATVDSGDTNICFELAVTPFKFSN